MALEDLLTEETKPAKLEVTGLIVWQCPLGHKVKDTVRSGRITTPVCPTCRDSGRKTTCRDAVLVEDFASAPSRTRDIPAVVSPRTSHALWDIFIAYLDAGRMRMADGSYSDKLCRLCVGYSHESLRPCTCPCHEARAFLLEQRKAS